jgi:hypothetical protein
MATCFIKSSVLIQKRKSFYTHSQALAPNRDKFDLIMLSLEDRRCEKLLGGYPPIWIYHQME